MVRFFDFSRWQPPPSWIFTIFKFLTSGRVMSAELRYYAKFRGDQSKFAEISRFLEFSRYTVSAADILILNISHF